VFLNRKFGGKLAAPEDHPLVGQFRGKAAEIARLYEQREFGKALREVMALADLANQYVDEEKPWELSKHKSSEAKLQQVCSLAIDLFRLLTIYLKPVLPELAADAERFLNVTPLQWQHAIELLPQYVDVAVERWQAFTGETAKLDKDGRPFADVTAERRPTSGDGQ